LPPAPQTPGFVPGMHTSLKQHPLPQVVGPHGLRLHIPASHRSSAVHTVQGNPPDPQAVSLGFLMHWLPLQQPVQLAGPQPSWVQAPFWHRSLLWQATQPEPLIPHAFGDVAEMSLGMHEPLGAQHPAQVAGLQEPPVSSPQPVHSIDTRHREARESNALTIVSMSSS
jgi:hypothetical protein